MGNDHAKTKKINNKGFDKNKLDITLKQIYFTAQLNKDRRKGQQNFREKELLALLREPVNKRSKDNEYHKAAAIVNDLKWIKAQECVMRYTDILKDNQMVMQMSKGDATKIGDLIPYVESVIWGCQKGNLDCVKQLQDFICGAFGSEVLAQLCNFTQVTTELKDCYNSILPSENEVKAYLIDLCQRQGITIETMNEVGHNLSISPSLSEQNSRPNNFPSNPPSASSGGFPINSSPAGYSGGSHHTNHSQAGYFNYPQPNFPPENYPSYPYGTYPQGNGQGGSHHQAPNNPHQFAGFAPSSSDEFYKQSPAFNNPASANINLNTNFEQSQRQTNVPDSSSNAYPTFPQFANENATRNAGSGDTLNELETRLRDIKNGL